MSLVELVITMGLAAILLAPVVSLTQVSHRMAEAHDSDHVRLEAAHATMRHLLRALRQAEQVVAITDPSQPAGRLVLRMPGGGMQTWERVGDNVLFGFGTQADQLLAEGVTRLSFERYLMDGATPAPSGAQTRVVRCIVEVQLDRETNPTRTVRSWVWLRAS